MVEEANIEKEELQRTLKGRFVFLKMDACTCYRVNYFAINVRFVDENNKIVTPTLAIKDTEAHHTSEYPVTQVKWFDMPSFLKLE